MTQPFKKNPKGTCAQVAKLLEAGHHPSEVIAKGYKSGTVYATASRAGVSVRSRLPKGRAKVVVDYWNEHGPTHPTKICDAIPSVPCAQSVYGALDRWVGGNWREDAGVRKLRTKSKEAQADKMIEELQNNITRAEILLSTLIAERDAE